MKLMQLLVLMVMGGWLGLTIPAWAEAPSVANHIARGKELMKEHKFDEAVASFSQALQLDPQSTTALFQRGNAYCRQRNFQQAVQDYDAVIRLEPKNAKAYNNRAVAHWFLGDWLKAREDLKKAESLGAQINWKAWEELYNSPTNPPSALDPFRPEGIKVPPAPPPKP